jgi:hypothetical protein
LPADDLGICLLLVRCIGIFTAAVDAVGDGNSDGDDGGVVDRWQMMRNV